MKRNRQIIMRNKELEKKNKELENELVHIYDKHFTLKENLPHIIKEAICNMDVGEIKEMKDNDV